MENTSQVFGNNEVDVSKKTFMSAVFGQFATKIFWRDLFAMLVKEAISNFITVLGGTLIYSVQKRVAGESVEIRRIVDRANVAENRPSPSQAFSYGHSQQPTYRPTHSSNTPSYPGFGS